MKNFLFISQNYNIYFSAKSKEAAIKQISDYWKEVSEETGYYNEYLKKLLDSKNIFQKCDLYEISNKVDLKPFINIEEIIKFRNELDAKCEAEFQKELEENEREEFERLSKKFNK